MLGRRQFLQLGSLGISTFTLKSCVPDGEIRRPLVLSTWPEGIEANKVAWDILRFGGRALDAVEIGVMVTEASVNCCVGLGANPDREGFVTLDASIMDELGNCGRVGDAPIIGARLFVDNEVGAASATGDGEYGGYCILSGFSYAVCYANDKNYLVNSKHHHFWMDKFF